MALYSSRAGGRLLRPAPAKLLAGARTAAPPHPTDHDQLDGEDEERRPDHRSSSRCNHFGLEVEGVPDRETSPVATFTREPIPDREGDRHELCGRERGAR